MLFMIISMILFWGLIIGGIIVLVRFIFPGASPKTSQDALEILKEPYTMGEVGKE